MQREFALKGIPLRVCSKIFRIRQKNALEETIVDLVLALTGGTCPITKVIVTEDSTSPAATGREVLGLGTHHLWV